MDPQAEALLRSWSDLIVNIRSSVIGQHKFWQAQDTILLNYRGHKRV